MAIKSAFMGFSRRFHGIFIKVAIHSVWYIHLQKCYDALNIATVNQSSMDTLVTWTFSSMSSSEGRDKSKEKTMQEAVNTIKCSQSKLQLITAEINMPGMVLIF